MVMIERLRCAVLRKLGCSFPETDHEALYENLLVVVRQRDAARDRCDEKTSWIRALEQQLKTERRLRRETDAIKRG